MKSRSQQFLDAIEAQDVSLLPKPITREDMFYHALITRDTEGLTPVTSEERYLLAIEAFLGIGGSGPIEPEEPVDPLARTRANFAIVSNYTYSYKPTQTQVDSFIDSSYANSPVFYLVSMSDAYLYVLTTTGTYITVNETAKTVSSDGTIYSLETGGTSRDRGTSINWSAQSSLITHETFTR